jgi:hypothetical protein
VADRRNGDTDTRLGLVRDDLDTARYLLEKHLQETDGVLPEAIANGAYSVRVEDDGSLTFVTLGLKFGASQGTAGQLLTSAGAGVAPAWADPPGGGGSIITVAHGGTGQDFSAVARGSVIYFSAAGVMSTLAPGTGGYVLSTNGAGADPTWISVAAASGVTGSGTASKVARWSAGAVIGNAALSDDGTDTWLPSGNFGIGLDPTGAFALTQKYGFGGSFTNAAGDFAAMWRNGAGTNVFGIAGRTTTPGVFLATNNSYDLWLIVDGNTARGIKITQATGLVVVAGAGMALTGTPGAAPANTANVGATYNVAAGSNSGTNDTVASVDFYRSSTFKGAIGMDAASAAVIAGHTHAKDDFWIIGQSGNYSVVIGVDDHVYLKGKLSLGDKFYPATDGAAGQAATAIYGNTGAPNNANGANGDFYFRADGGAGTTIYQRRAGAWVGIV